MKAFITSIGEPTTELCKWSLERFGFDAEVIENNLSLAEKLKEIYNRATDTFIRVDADVIVYRGVKELLTQHPRAWWVYGKVFDIYKGEVISGGVSLIRKPAIDYLRNNVDMFLKAERPETELWRIGEFRNPRKCEHSDNIICGLHGFGQKDIERVVQTKNRRNQFDYDWELSKKLKEYYR